MVDITLYCSPMLRQRVGEILVKVQISSSLRGVQGTAYGGRKSLEHPPGHEGREVESNRQRFGSLHLENSPVDYVFYSG